MKRRRKRERKERVAGVEEEEGGGGGRARTRTEQSCLLNGEVVGRGEMWKQFVFLDDS